VFILIQGAFRQRGWAKPVMCEGVVTHFRNNKELVGSYEALIHSSRAGAI